MEHDVKGEMLGRVVPPSVWSSGSSCAATVDQRAIASKTDPRYARKLARLLAGDLLETIRGPSPELEAVAR
jgi:hypothetical protein